MIDSQLRINCEINIVKPPRIFVITEEQIYTIIEYQFFFNEESTKNINEERNNWFRNRVSDK